ncbi:DUF2254 domain-containing protein [Pararhodobacter marinus]|uniref:DUF2254 domain-containing protein n=1 Tax=Pararhodobacter marinus TaxID=2184063 RepID=UPI0035152E1C
MSVFLVWLRRLVHALWFRVALFAALAVVAVVMAHSFAFVLPDWAGVWIDAQSVLPVLEILSSSMLAVSTFSLGIMVQSHRAAAQTATPRVLNLMIQDGLTQTVLGIFIGAFVYALTALILFQAGFDGGAPMVLIVTLIVIGAVVLALVRWIAHLTTLGTMRDALDRAEARAHDALDLHRRRPALGASPMTAETLVADHVHTVTARTSGFLQVIDVRALSECASGPIWVLRRPGQQVLRGAPLLQVAGEADADALRRCFVIGDARTFEQDPVFGLTVLSEIASRALSPAVNDPGTAIEVVSRLERLLWDWSLPETDPGPEDGSEPSGDAAPRYRQRRIRVDYPRVFVQPWTAEEMVEAAFAPIARDGAAMIEVATQLLDALDALSQSPDSALAAAARRLAPRVRAHAGAALRLESDVDRLPAGPAETDEKDGEGADATQGGTGDARA